MAETDLAALAASLLEQIAEDEQTARDVARGPAWAVAEAKPTKWGDATPDTELIGGGKLIARFAEEYGGYLNALHAERWDPKRVLAECDARRRIVQEYQRVSAALDPLTRRLRAGEPLSLEEQALRDRLALELIGFGFAVAALAGATLDAGGDGMSSR